MKSGIILHQSSSINSFDTLNSIRKDSFTSSLGAAAVNISPSYSVLVDPENFFFSVKIPQSKNFDGMLNLGQFKADLWKQDVVEIFIAADQDSSYQEINLAPSGAYWTAKFSDYRNKIAESEMEIRDIQIERRPIISGLELSIKVPKNSIIESCSFSENSRLCCCAIIGKDPRNYFSTAELDSEKTDFHVVSTWGKLHIESIP